MNAISKLCLPGVFIIAIASGCGFHDGRDKDVTEPTVEGPFAALQALIEVENGSLRGAVNAGPDGELETDDDILLWQGIPYAGAPVGANRWREPMPAVDWEGERDATAPGAACLQGDTEVTVIQSEDCLLLNIAAPVAETATRRPVMVWFHGGGDDNGSGHEFIYNLVSLAQGTGHVVVSVNSRLGFLGFMALPELREESADGSTGNYHHLDQIAALQWLQNNIESFNGDPERVTIFGESAGAIDGCRHLSSRASDGLFQRAILQSSVCGPNVMHSLEERYVQGQMFKEIWGCADTTTPLDCLRQRDALDLRQDLSDAGKSNNLLSGDLLAQEAFRPVAVIDGSVFTHTPYVAMTDSPSTVEVILGVTPNEFTLFLMAEGNPNPDDSLASYQQALRDSLAGINEAQVVTLSTALYPCSDYPSCSDAHADVMGDAIFACASINSADVLAASGHSVRFYEFTQPVNTTLLLSSTIPVFDENAPAIGVPHSSDLFYLWDLAILQAGDTPEKVVSGMREYWASFADNGDPVSNGNPDWPLYTAAGGEYLNIGTPFESRSGFKLEKCEFFEAYWAE